MSLAHDMWINVQFSIRWELTTTTFVFIKMSFVETNIVRKQKQKQKQQRKNEEKEEAREKWNTCTKRMEIWLGLWIVRIAIEIIVSSGSSDSRQE